VYFVPENKIVIKCDKLVVWIVMLEMLEKNNLILIQFINIQNSQK
jgi:hypothetical protein